MSLSITIGMRWARLPSDGHTCYECKEQIQGTRYNMEIVTGELVSPTKLNVCEPCLNQTKKDYANLRPV